MQTDRNLLYFRQTKYRHFVAVRTPHFVSQENLSNIPVAKLLLKYCGRRHVCNVDIDMTWSPSLVHAKGTYSTTNQDHSQEATHTRLEILIIKPTRRTNFSNLFFGIKLYMFRSVPLSIIRFVDSLRAVSKPVWHIPFLCVQ